MTARLGCLPRTGIALATLCGSALLFYALLALWQPTTEGELVVAMFVFVAVVISIPSAIVFRMTARKRLQANRAELLRMALICPACGYNCRKTPERCPECGTQLPAAR